MVDKRSLKGSPPRDAQAPLRPLPLAELAPQVVHPQLKQTVSALLAHVKDDKRVMLLPRA
jgi:hypothetical protein